MGELRADIERYKIKHDVILNLHSDTGCVAVTIENLSTKGIKLTFNSDFNAYDTIASIDLFDTKGNRKINRRKIKATIKHRFEGRDKYAIVEATSFDCMKDAILYLKSNNLIEYQLNQDDTIFPEVYKVIVEIEKKTELKREKLIEWIKINQINDVDNQLAIVKCIGFLFDPERKITNKKLADSILCALKKIYDENQEKLVILTIENELFPKVYKEQLQKILQSGNIQDECAKLGFSIEPYTLGRFKNPINRAGIASSHSQQYILTYFGAFISNRDDLLLIVEWIKEVIDPNVLTCIKAIYIVALYTEDDFIESENFNVGTILNTQIKIIIINNIRLTYKNNTNVLNLLKTVEQYAKDRFEIFYGYWARNRQSTIRFEFGWPATSNLLLWADFDRWHPLINRIENLGDGEGCRPIPKAPDFTQNKRALERLVRQLNENKIIFLGGASGSGKTYLGTYVFSIFKIDSFAFWHDLTEFSTIENLLEHFDSFIKNNSVEIWTKNGNSGAFDNDELCKNVWNSTYDMLLVVDMILTKIARLKKKIVVVIDKFEKVYTGANQKYEHRNRPDYFIADKDKLLSFLSLFVNRVAAINNNIQLLIIYKTKAVTLKNQFHKIFEKLRLPAKIDDNNILYCPIEDDWNNHIESYSKLAEKCLDNSNDVNQYKRIFRRITHFQHYHTRLICFVINCFSDQPKILGKLLRTDCPAAYADTWSFHRILDCNLMEIYEWKGILYFLRIASVFEFPWKLCYISEIMKNLKFEFTFDVLRICEYLVKKKCPFIIKLDYEPLSLNSQFEMPSIVQRHFREFLEIGTDLDCKEIYKKAFQVIGRFSMPANSFYVSDFSKSLQLVYFCIRGGDIQNAEQIFLKFKKQCEQNHEQIVYLGNYIYEYVNSSAYSCNYYPNVEFFQCYIYSLLRILELKTALKVCKYAVNLFNNQQPKIAHLHARVLRSYGEYSESEKILKELIKQVEATNITDLKLIAEIYYDYGQLLLTLGRINDAFTIISSNLIKIDETPVRNLFTRLLINIHMLKGKFNLSLCIIKKEIDKLNLQKHVFERSVLKLKELQLYVSILRENENLLMSNYCNSVVINQVFIENVTKIIQIIDELKKTENTSMGNDPWWWSAILNTIAEAYIVLQRNVTYIKTNQQGLDLNFDLDKEIDDNLKESKRCILKNLGEIPKSRKLDLNRNEIIFGIIKETNSQKIITTDYLHEKIRVISQLISEQSEFDICNIPLSDEQYCIENITFHQWHCLQTMYELIVILCKMKDINNSLPERFKNKSLHEEILYNIGIIYQKATILNDRICGENYIRSLNLLIINVYREEKLGLREYLEAACRMVNEEDSVFENRGTELINQKLTENNTFSGMVDKIIQTIEVNQKAKLQQVGKLANRNDKMVYFYDIIIIETVSVINNIRHDNSKWMKYCNEKIKDKYCSGCMAAIGKKCRYEPKFEDKSKKIILKIYTKLDSLDKKNEDDIIVEMRENVLNFLQGLIVTKRHKSEI
jgi:tRNA A37 threonylcarbamoyladenosine biosynthesis protein TsaE